MKRNIPVLIDLDGVIRIGGKLADGANELFQFLKDNEIPSCIISNSTRNTSLEVMKFLVDSGVNHFMDGMTTVDATFDYISENNFRVSVYCAYNVKKEFDEFIDDKNPDAVVIGDLGEEWSYSLLNDIFRKVNNGAEIIAMQKNKFWKPDGKNLALDAGAFVAAIEYATGKQATLIGKPSPLYFRAALKKLGYEESEAFYMIGDDLENDIAGAQAIGGLGILVFTGKTKFPLGEETTIKPKYTAQNLTEATELLTKIYL